MKKDVSLRSFLSLIFYLVKVCDEYDGRRAEWQGTKLEKTIIYYVNGVRSIEKSLSTFGKDGRFQSWCCLACKYVLNYNVRFFIIHITIELYFF